MQSGLDTRDAAVNSLLQEVAQLLQLLVKQGGEPLVQHLASSIIPQSALLSDLQVSLYTLASAYGTSTCLLICLLSTVGKLEVPFNAPELCTRTPK